MSAKAASLAGSLMVHAVIVTVGGWALVKPVGYGMQTGQGGLEVSLIAAPAEVLEEQSPPAALPQEVPSESDTEQQTEAPASDTMSVVPSVIEAKSDIGPKSSAQPAAAKPDPPTRLRLESPVQGDGSSTIPGASPTTFHSSSGGASSEAKPDYLKNPAPAYPWEARRNGWEGTVTLRVVVAPDGRPRQVDVEQSSGRSVLDNAAVKTVRTWRFRPAMVGPLPVESLVRFPVRFELNNEAAAR